MTGSPAPETSVAADRAAVVAAAVTALFVPGDRPDRYRKAAVSGADVVIIDLEDAVAPGARADALASVTAALADPPELAALVRMTAIGTPTHDDEISALARLAGTRQSGLLGVVVPKAQDPDAVGALARQLHGHDPRLAVVALIESAAGVLTCAQLAAVPGVTRLALGAIDLTSDVDAELDSPIVTHAMAALVLASRAHALAGPLDSPATAIKDADAVAASARAGRAAGFTGKLCIHPAQISAVRAAFHPTTDQLAWARKVIAAGDAAVQIDGHMIDKPVIDKAHRILRRAGMDH